MVLLNVPNIGLESGATIMGLVVASFMANIRLLGFLHAPKTMRCIRNMQKNSLHAAADSIILEKEIMHYLLFMILEDKGDGKVRFLVSFP